ncbi:CCA tRNA nucleotidyltransferase [Aestuariivirga sp.]|uniref:CCA tRNA nucleotidyltransferase n=1 Tax=Aestuariivirga sp. TaxID=2650926 RepID=UPI0039E5C6FD
MKKLPSLARARWLKEPGLQRIFAVIAEAGGEARVAGGAVRNALLGVPIADIDVAVTLPPERVAEVCGAAGFAVHPTGIDHGTVTVVALHKPYEVTTLRHDVETDGRRARVEFHDDWEKDALRRDFTMNALYCDARGKITDFTDGYRDILRKRIIFVGDPSQRIHEDYLRILRFFRFHARFGKGAPDKAGLAACRRLAKGIDGLSAERIRQEMLKLLEAPRAIPTLKVMAREKILKCILPYTEEWRVLERLPADGVLRLAMLAEEPRALAHRLRLSNAEAKRIARLLSATPPTPSLRPREQRMILYHLGPETWRDAVHLAWARSRAPLTDPGWKRLLRLPHRWPIPQLPVDGRDLIAHGLAPGPLIGETLKRLEDWWIASDFKPTRSELLARI